MVNIAAKEYSKVFEHILTQIHETKAKIATDANRELAILYWTIGKIISEQQGKSGWGTNFIGKLSKDLQSAFPGTAGFSRTNVFRMKAFYEAYSKNPTAVGQIEDLPIFKIPWGHNSILLDKLKYVGMRLWYAQKVLENGWSRSVLAIWIESDLYNRQGKALTNFQVKLPKPDSDLAREALKDPYLFDFLTLKDEHVELDIENQLIDHIQRFLLELGQGFAFVGQQVHLSVGNKDYYIDLLFYHLHLRCFIVVELKAREFDPRDAGQVGFYLAAIDDIMKKPEDKPTIGLLLCKEKNTFTVEYALRASSMPIGVASYVTKIVETLPKDLKGSLPTVEQLEEEFNKQTIIAEMKTKKNVKYRQEL